MSLDETRLLRDAFGCFMTGVTVVLCEEPATAAVQVLGGAPGTRETDLLEPHNTVETVDALVLSGGSAFGLDAASGVQAGLREMGRGFAVGPHRVPIVPAAAEPTSAQQLAAQRAACHCTLPAAGADRR